MTTPVRSIKISLTVEDDHGLYDSRTRSLAEQRFPAETATLASIAAWATRSAANALRDAERAFPLAVEIANAPVALDKPLGQLTDEDAAAIDALPF